MVATARERLAEALRTNANEPQASLGHFVKLASAEPSGHSCSTGNENATTEERPLPSYDCPGETLWWIRTLTIVALSDDAGKGNCRTG